MAQQDVLLELIGGVYDAALAPALWPELLNRLGDAVGGPSVNFGIFDPESGLMQPLAPRMPPDDAKTYVERWASLNPLWRESLRVAPGKIFRPADFMPIEEFIRTPFYNEWWHRVGFDVEPVAANIFVDGAASAVLSCCTQPGSGPIGNDGRRLFAQFVPHAIRAVELYRRVHHLALARDEAVTKLDDLHQGFFLLDAGARVLFANRLGQKLLAAADGLMLVQGVLTAALREANAALRARVASCVPGVRRSEAAQITIGGRLAIPRPGRAPLDVIVTPVRANVAEAHIPWIVRPRPVAILLVSDPERTLRTRIDAMRQRFGLTAAEARFAFEVARGDGREAAARRAGITVATARTHLSRIFEKTGARRQAEFLRLLMQENGSAVPQADE